MDNWVIVWMLSLVECIAPPGKVVCEKEPPLEIIFVDAADCSVVLDTFVQLYMDLPNVLLVDVPRCKAVPHLLSAPHTNESQIELLRNRDRAVWLNQFPSEQEAMRYLSENATWLDNYVSLYWQDYQRGRR